MDWIAKSKTLEIFLLNTTSGKVLGPIQGHHLMGILSTFATDERVARSQCWSYLLPRSENI